MRRRRSELKIHPPLGRFAYPSEPPWLRPRRPRPGYHTAITNTETTITMRRKITTLTAGPLNYGRGGQQPAAATPLTATRRSPPPPASSGAFSIQHSTCLPSTKKISRGLPGAKNTQLVCSEEYTSSKLVLFCLYIPKSDYSSAVPSQNTRG